MTLDYLKRYAAATLAVAVGVFAASVYHYLTKPEATPAGQVVEAKPSPDIVEQKQTSVPIKSKTVSVYSGVKGKLRIPDEVKSDPAWQPVSSSVTENDGHEHKITTLLNTDTGQSKTYDEKLPLPWLKIDTTTEVGVYAGYRNSQQVARVQVKQAVLNVKAVTAEAVASCDQFISAPIKPDCFVGIGASLRF